MNLLRVNTASKRIFIMAHGAGAPMTSQWMESITKHLKNYNIQVIRFEFPYMEQRKLTDKKTPPNRKPILLKSWINVVREVQKKLKIETKDIYIGGKSMGGRMASLICDELNVKGLICLGFPFHAPKKDPKDRISHLSSLRTKTMIIQGTRDPMGTKKEVSTYKLSKQIKIHWLEDGNHDLKPRVKSGYTFEFHMENSAKLINSFIR